MPHHSSSMDFTHSQTMFKPLKIKFSIIFTSLFHNIFTHTISYHYQMKVFSKVLNTHLYTNQNETKQENFKILHLTRLTI